MKAEITPGDDHPIQLILFKKSYIERRKGLCKLVSFFALATKLNAEKCSTSIERRRKQFISVDFSIF